MPRYRVYLRPAAERDLERLHEPMHGRVDAVLELLSDVAQPRGSRKLEGRGELRRLRVGDYRILYEVVEDTIRVFRIVHRKEAYRF